MVCEVFYWDGYEISIEYGFLIKVYIVESNVVVVLLLDYLVQLQIVQIKFLDGILWLYKLVVVFNYWYMGVVYDSLNNRVFGG